MDDNLDKDAIGRELAACIAVARELRASRATDPAAADYPVLKEWQSARLARTYADLLASERLFWTLCRIGSVWPMVLVVCAVGLPPMGALVP